MLEKVLEMLPKTKKKKPFKLQKLRVIKAFNLARCKGYSRLRRLACSATAAAQQYPPHTSRLKTVHRTVFLTPLTLSGFESLENIKKNRSNTCGIASVLGALQGIRTPDLLVRSQTLYPTELAAHLIAIVY